MLPENKFTPLIEELVTQFANFRYVEIVEKLDFLDSRLSMVGAEKLLALSEKEFTELVSLMLEDGPGSSLVEWIEKLYKAKLLELLLRPNYHQFSVALDQYYVSIQEIVVQTAVNMPAVMRTRIDNLLKSGLSNQIRVIYRENPEILAGAVVKYQGKMYDYSFQTNGTFLINQAVKLTLSP